jgi:hypothetical protein
VQWIAILVVLALCCGPAYARSCTPVPSGIVSWWPGDVNENDIIGSNNPSAVQEVSLVTAEVLDGFTFGSNGYIAVPASSSLANQQFTWDAWVRPDGPGSTNDQYGSVILLQNVSETASAYDVIALDWSYSTSLFNFTFGEEDSETIFSKDTFPPGSFYLVAVTYDGTAFRLYVNGVLESSRRSKKTIQYSSVPWGFGQSFIQGGPGSGFRQWNGIIDEVQAYNRALTRAEIKAIYRAGSAGVCKP